MEDRLATLRRGDDRSAIRQVALDLHDTHRIQRRIPTAVEAADVVAARDQSFAQFLAEESTAASDQNLHVDEPSPGCFAAHVASFSRPIFALWRMSTGNFRG